MSGTLRKCDCSYKNKARKFMCSCGVSLEDCTPSDMCEPVAHPVVEKLAPYTMRGSKFVPLDILIKRLDRRFKG